MRLVSEGADCGSGLPGIGTRGHGLYANRLMFSRETRALLDIVVGTPSGEHHSYESVDQFVADRQHMMRDVYSAVREHLQRAAERRKKIMTCVLSRCNSK